MAPINNKNQTSNTGTNPLFKGIVEVNEVMHVHNPFTDEEVNITQEQLNSVEKGIEAQTERD